MPIYISQHEKNKAEAFTESLNSILELVEALVGIIGEGNYLAIANHLKILNDNKSTMEIIEHIHHHVRSTVREFRTNQTVETMFRRTQMELMNANQIINGERTVRCVKCDRTVSKDYLRTHQHSIVCREIYNTKKLTCKVAKTEVNKYHDAIAIIKSWCIKTGRYNKFVGSKN